MTRPNGWLSLETKKPEKPSCGRVGGMQKPSRKMGARHIRSFNKRKFMNRRYQGASPGQQPPTSTSEKNLSKARSRKRQKLRKKGWTEAQIADYIEQMQYHQDVALFGEEKARQMRYDRVPTPDDAGYKPTRYDPLLNGACRATGDTARAVKSKKAIVT